jgi:quercetin dioxygenase-like cupin family protein
MTDGDHRQAIRPSDRAQGLLVSSESNGGAFALMEYDIPPKTLVAPLHTHTREDEYSFVISGAVGTQIGDETIVGEARQLLTKPRGIPHTLWNPTDEPARVLELIVPGGFERCLAMLYRRGGTPSGDELDALWSEYGIEMQPESVEELRERHELTAVAVS